MQFKKAWPEFYQFNLFFESDFQFDIAHLGRMSNYVVE